MFARVTTYELVEGRASESIDAFQPAIDHVRELEGLVDAYFMGCLHKVFDVEIDLDVLGELEGRRDGFGAVKARRSPLPICHSEISACYEHRLDELGCRNPEFHELPLERPSFRVFAHVAD